MDHLNIKELIQLPSYSFIMEPEIYNNLMFLTFGGSHAYGTNLPGSDIDIRGVSANTRKELIGLSNAEQRIDEETDTTIYRFNKFIKLILNCNPNTIELLGCRPETYSHVSKLGQALLDNKRMFLSKRAINSFGGYATQQLRRLQNAIVRDKFSQSEKETHILNSCTTSTWSFNERYQSYNGGHIWLSIQDSQKTEMESEIMLNINLKDYPLRDFTSIINEFLSILKMYNKVNHRNKKKDDEHLNKHAMHLIRLYLMCIDILEKEEIVTYRKDDIPLLLSIRNGNFQNKDGVFISDFFEMVNDLEKRMQYAAQNTNLPKNPDYNLIEEFVMDVNGSCV